MDERQSEVDKNYQVFKERLPSLSANIGKYVLMREGEIKGIYDTFMDAVQTANIFYEDGRFSIQRVTSIPVDLGCRSRRRASE